MLLKDYCTKSPGRCVHWMGSGLGPTFTPSLLWSATAVHPPPLHTQWWCNTSLNLWLKSNAKMGSSHQDINKPCHILEQGNFGNWIFCDVSSPQNLSHRIRLLFCYLLPLCHLLGHCIFFLHQCLLWRHNFACATRWNELFAVGSRILIEITLVTEGSSELKSKRKKRKILCTSNMWSQFKHALHLYQKIKIKTCSTHIRHIGIGQLSREDFSLSTVPSLPQCH